MIVRHRESEIRDSGSSQRGRVDIVIRNSPESEGEFSEQVEDSLRRKSQPRFSTVTRVVDLRVLSVHEKGQRLSDSRWPEMVQNRKSQSTRSG